MGGCGSWARTCNRPFPLRVCVALFGVMCAASNLESKAVGSPDTSEMGPLVHFRCTRDTASNTEIFQKLEVSTDGRDAGCPHRAQPCGWFRTKTIIQTRGPHRCGAFDFEYIVCGEWEWEYVLCVRLRGLYVCVSVLYPLCGTNGL